MKTNLQKIRLMQMSILVIVICELISTTLFAQGSHLAKYVNNNTVASGNLLEYYNSLLQTSVFGIGTSPLMAPPATFDIKNVLGTNPILKIEETTGTNFLKFLYTDFNSGTPYGIYQTGPALINYFQGSLGTNSGFYFDGSGPNISSHNSGIITFNVQNTPTQIQYTPLTLFNANAIVQDKLSCQNILISNGAVQGYVLTSLDNNGNGIWTDPSKFIGNNWLVNNDGDLYQNPVHKQVGIGFQLATDKIYQQLHVLDGNILISRSNAGGIGVSGLKAPSSKNGSILFGDVVTDKNTLGEWGIEYQTKNTDYNSNGLNFWKPFSSSSGGGDNYLFLRNDGNVGIGTNTPGDKLQVNDGLGRVVFGTGPGNVNPEFPPSNKKIGNKNQAQAQAPEMPDLGLGYIGFNANRNSKNQWELSSNGWDDAASLVYNDLNGAMYFCTIPGSGVGTGQILSQQDIYNKTKMRIDTWGNTTMGENISDLGNAGTNGTLTVRRRSECNIIADAMDMPCKTSPLSGETGGAALWAITSRNGFSLSTDATGIGHINENFNNPQSIMSFHSGNIGIPGNLAITGKVGIGNNIDPTSYPNCTCRLFVGGGILTEAVFVKLQSGGWPDFVFNKNNKLRPISELAQYIVDNQHLPDVPTSADVKKDGVELGKMDAILLQKVEELSLYVIELKKEITELQNKKSN